MGAWQNTTGKRLYLAKDGKTVVEEGDERAASLLVGIDGELPEEEAAKYDLPGQQRMPMEEPPAAEPETQQPPAAEPDSQKAKPTPANKAKDQSSNKA